MPRPSGAERTLRCAIVDARVRLGRTSRVQETLVELNDAEFETGEARAMLAHLALAGDDPRAALEVLGPVLNDTAPVHHGGGAGRARHEPARTTGAPALSPPVKC